MTARGVTAAPFGVYVHFPYCTKRCPYCDFAVSVRRTIPHERYASAVVAELEARTAEFSGRVASTVYFGGGTPGLWRPESLARVIDAIRTAYALTDDAEITVEVNPGEASGPHLEALCTLGVNRLSIGAQSFDDRSLAVLGRTHDASAARTAVRLARAAGHANVSVDLIFGLPQASRAALDRELEAVLSLETEHVSLYQLTVEPRTAFAALVRERALVLPDDDLQAELYERVIHSRRPLYYTLSEPFSSEVEIATDPEHSEVADFSSPNLGRFLEQKAPAFAALVNAAAVNANPLPGNRERLEHFLEKIVEDGQCLGILEDYPEVALCTLDLFGSSQFFADQLIRHPEGHPVVAEAEELRQVEPGFYMSYIIPENLTPPT